MCIWHSSTPSTEHVECRTVHCNQMLSQAHGSAAVLNLTQRRSKTTQPIDTKFETGDYVRKTTPCAKFRANPILHNSTAYWLLDDVMVSDITFLWFLLLSMCQSLHVTVNKCINWCFVHLWYYCKTSISQPPLRSLHSLALKLCTLCAGWAKNGTIFVHLIISPNINRLSKFFHCQNQETIK